MINFYTGYMVQQRTDELSGIKKTTGR